MDSTRFDRLARALVKTLTRRGLFAIAVGATAGFGPRVARGTQLGPATCGAQGAVCTHLAGCCGGLTCATSAINTNYGVCVPGEGGMTSIGTTLISPFSETVVEEVTALLQTTSSTTTTVDLEAEREARIAEIKARKDAKQLKRKTRKSSKRTTQQTRKNEQQNRRLEARETVEVALGPRLQLELITSIEDGDSETEGVQPVPVDTVRVTNLDDVNVVLTRIESRLAGKDGQSLTTSPSRFTLVPGRSYFFVSGLTPADATSERFDWTDAVACDGTPGAGYLVKAAFSVNSDNHDFVVLCDGPRVTGVAETPAATPRRKRKKNDDKNKRNNNKKKR